MHVPRLCKFASISRMGHSDCPRRSPSVGAFSLVEVTMAIGIVAFVFLTILGLIPTGLNTFHNAITTSVSGQIFQRVINEAQQTDFDILVDRLRLPNYPNHPPANFTFRAPSVNAPGFRYFDEQGNECTAAEAVYHVNIRITPSTAIDVLENANIATITVQVARNPGNQKIDMADNLWTSNSSFEILTRSTFVARSH